MMTNILKLALISILTFAKPAFATENPPFAHYDKIAAKHSVKYWEFETVNDSDAIPEAAGPIEKHFNDTIIWGLDSAKNKIIGFRAINTTTGCQSGCTPVIFHLVVNPDGSPKEVLQHPQSPLRKLYHQEFTAKDIRGINNTLQEMPASLAWVGHPSQTTNKFGPFPPQTWSVFQKTLINDAAYTSFVIFNIALSTHLYVGKNSEPSEWKEARQKLISLFNQHQTCLKEHERCMRESLELMMKEKNINPLDRRHAISFYFFNLSNLLRSKAPAGQEDVQLNKINASLKVLPQDALQSRKNDLIAIFVSMLESEQNAKILQSILKTEKELLNLGDSIASSLQQLTAIVTSQWQSNQTAQIDIEALLNLTQDQPVILVKVLEEAIRYKNLKDFCLKAMAQIELQSPEKISTSAAILQFKEKQQTEYEKFREQAKSQYIMKMLRGFSLEPEDFPTTQGISRKTRKTVSVPNTDNHKSIYIFFASWCGHCNETVKALVEKSSPALLDKIQLVEVFKESRDFYPSFANYTKVDSANMEVISVGKEEKEFYKRMSLFAVPKVVIVNKDNKIVNFSYELDTHHDHFERDLNWVLEK